MRNMQAELGKCKEELDRQQSERVRIAYVIVFIVPYTSSHGLTLSSRSRSDLLAPHTRLRTRLSCILDKLLECSNSKLEAEADEKLQVIYHQLLQAGVDRTENEREVKMRETLASLQELFPGAFPSITRLANSDNSRYVR
jgi:hypothetical protein